MPMFDQPTGQTGHVRSMSCPVRPQNVGAGPDGQDKSLRDVLSVLSADAQPLVNLSLIPATTTSARHQGSGFFPGAGRVRIAPSLGASLCAKILESKNHPDPYPRRAPVVAVVGETRLRFPGALRKMPRTEAPRTPRTSPMPERDPSDQPPLLR